MCLSVSAACPLGCVCLAEWKLSCACKCIADNFHNVFATGFADRHACPRSPRDCPITTQEEFHEKILQHKFYLEEVKQQKVAMQLRLTEAAQEQVASEVQALKANLAAQREQDREEAHAQRERLRNALQEEHAAAIAALTTKHEAVVRRLEDDHALEVQRMKLRVDDELKVAAVAAEQNAREGVKDEVDALRVYPRKLQLEHQEKLDEAAQETAARLREMREQ